MVWLLYQHYRLFTISTVLLIHYLTIIVSSVVITDNIIEEWKSEEDRVILQKCIPRKLASVSGTISYSHVSVSFVGIADLIMHFLTFKRPFLQQQQPCRDSLGGPFRGYKLGSVVPTLEIDLHIISFV